MPIAIDGRRLRAFRAFLGSFAPMPLPCSFDGRSLAKAAAMRAGHPQRSWNALVAAAIAATALTVALHAFLVYRSFFEDDAFISLRYATRLLQGKGLTWSDGDRVEGYTNFLWVLLIALGSGIARVDPIAVARALGVASAVAATAGVFGSQFPRRPRELAILFACALAAALSTPVAVWTMGGLEEPLVAAFVVWGIVLTYPAVESETTDFRSFAPGGLCFALASITRADGFVFAAAGAIGLLVATGGPGRRGAWIGAAKLLALPLAFVVAHVAFRRVYYQSWVPNTAHAKVAFGWNRVQNGWSYWTQNPLRLETFAAAKVFAISAALTDPVRRKRIAFAATPLASWTAYILLMGGDTMPAQRHVVPLVFLSALVDAEGLVWWCRQRPPMVLTAHVAALGLVLHTAWVTVADPDRASVQSEQWEWTGRPVGLFLKRAFGDRAPLLAVDAAGATPYFAEIDALDMLGLNDRYLGLHRPSDMGAGTLGHELGDGAYVLRRKPDLVLFHVPPGQADPPWRGGQEMIRDPAFAELYRLVRFRTIETREDPSREATLWVRIDNSRVGIERTPGRVVVPGFVLASMGAPFAELDESGRLAASLAPGQSIAISTRSTLRLGAGAWRGGVDADAAVTMTVAGEPAQEETSGTAVTFAIGPSGPGIVVVSNRAASAAHVRALTFVRAGGEPL
jgi:arabinofuranosyltransferase